MKRGTIFPTRAKEIDPDLIPLNLRAPLHNEANPLDRVAASAAGFGGKTAITVYSKLPQEY